MPCSSKSEYHFSPRKQQKPGTQSPNPLYEPRALFYFRSVAGNSKSTAGEGKDIMPFEDALKRLEDIVESMEAGDMPLETLLARFEEGTRMVKVCQERLEQAELKIKQLDKNPAGEIVLTKLEADPVR